MEFKRGTVSQKQHFLWLSFILSPQIDYWSISVYILWQKEVVKSCDTLFMLILYSIYSENWEKELLLYTASCSITSTYVFGMPEYSWIYLKGQCHEMDICV